MFSAVSMILALALLTMPVGNPSAENNQITISGFSLQDENNNYTPDASLTLYSDTQDGMQTLGMSVSGSGDAASVSVSLANDGNEIFLSPGSNERYYILSDEAINALTGDEMTDRWDSAFSTALALADVFSGDEAVAYGALSEYFDAFVAANAISAQDYTDKIGEKTISGKTIELNISLSHLLQALDTLSTSDTDGVRVLAEEILNAVNSTQNAEYTSFSELADAFNGGNVLPVSLTIAVDESGTVSRQIWSSSTESDESTMDILSQLDTDDKSISLSFNLNKENLSSVLSVSLNSTINMETADAGEVKGSCTVSIKNVSDDDSANAENAQETDNTEIALDFTSDYNTDGAQTVISGTARIPGSEPSTFALNIQTHREEENTVSDVRFTNTQNNTDTPLTISFTVTASSVPFSSPFSGTAIAIDSDLSADPGASVLLISDVIEFTKNVSSVFGSDAPVLMDDSQLYSFVNQLFASGENAYEAAAYSGSDDTDTLTEDPYITENEDAELTGDTEYNAETNSNTDTDYNEEPDTDGETAEDTENEYETGFKTVEEAAAVYAGTLPAIKTPDGYHIQDITADADSVLIEFTDDEDGYISVFVINDAETYDEYPVYYNNDDGTIYAAELLVGGVNVSIYIPDMPVSDAEALFTQMGLK